MSPANSAAMQLDAESASKYLRPVTELARLHSDLRIGAELTEDGPVRQALARPIFFEKALMGVVVAVNPRAGRFEDRDELAAVEIAQVIGTALFALRRAVRGANPARLGRLVDIRVDFRA